jgi:hypothetical protein
MLPRGDREPQSVPDSWYEEERIMVPSNHDRVVDLRSDTVTTPTPEMRRAMAEAEVGDDVFMEDPTVLRLEALAAERLGKEAALFVTSGTQGNQVSLMAHTERGDEIILDENCHIFTRGRPGGPLGRADASRTPASDPADVRDAIRRPTSTIRETAHQLETPTTAAVGRSTLSRRSGRYAGSRRSIGWPSTWTGLDFSTRAWRWGSPRRRWPRRRTR